MCDYREYEKMPVNSNKADKETTIYHLVDLKELFQHCDPEGCNNNSIKDTRFRFGLVFGCFCAPGKITLMCLKERKWLQVFTRFPCLTLTMFPYIEFTCNKGDADNLLQRCSDTKTKRLILEG